MPGRRKKLPLDMALLVQRIALNFSSGLDPHLFQCGHFCQKKMHFSDIEAAGSL
jgi:hypothetical protein